MKGFGAHMIIDLSGGNGYQKKTDEQNLVSFIEELCERIDMERHGPLIRDWFGNNNVEGWSLVQLITTSSIKGHFCGEYEEFPDTSNTAYLDIFSCKSFNEDDVISVVKKYFNQDIIDYKIVIRARPDKNRSQIIQNVFI